MSEKRFEISKDKYFIFDNTEDDFLDLEDVVNKLNALNEENEELKDDVYDELKEALKILEEIYEDYPKDNVHHLHSRLKGLLEEFR